MAKTKDQPAKIGFWTMVRDVLVASLNRGQFPVALVFMVVLVALLRMPEQDVSRLVFEVIDKLENGAILGYGLAAIALTAWYFHARWQRRVFTAEVTRVSQEKTALQKKSLGQGVKSSNQQ